MAHISAGALDRRIQVFRADQTKDGAGDLVQIWDPPAEKFDRWAAKRDSAGGEQVAEQQVVRDADTVWTLRWDSKSRSIAPESHRFMHKGTVYEIVSVTEIGRQDGLEFLCSSRPDLVGDRGRLLASAQP